MPVNDGATRAARDVDDLYRSHASEVYRYAYAVLGNRSDAEDVTQTTFVNALRALERGDRPRKPSNWLITIAHNIVRQRFRQQQTRPAEVELDDTVACAEPHESSPSLDDLVRALQRIPPAQREALVMRELEGRSYKEIEAILELTPGALETMLFRARRSLAEELENLVTCERAEFAMSKRLDGRLSRKERRRLEEHLQECPSCARLSVGRAKHRRAFGALTLLPLPFSLTFFRETPAASAAGVTTIGAGGVTAAAGGVTAAVCGSGCATGGLLAGGLAIKAVAVVAAATVAGSVGYEGVKHVREAHQASAPTVVAAPSSGTPAATAVQGHWGLESVPKDDPVAEPGPATADTPQEDVAPAAPLEQTEPSEPVPTLPVPELPQAVAPPPEAEPQQAAAPPQAAETPAPAVDGKTSAEAATPPAVETAPDGSASTSPAADTPAVDPVPATDAAPDGAPAADPAPAPDGAPVDTPAADPAPAPDGAPVDTPAADPAPAPDGAPVDTPAADPAPAPDGAPVVTPTAEPLPAPVPEASVPPDPAPATEPISTLTTAGP